MSSKDENEKLKEEKEKLKEENENGNENENENEDENENENENEDEDDIIKILIHSNEYYEETNQNKKNKIIKKLNDNLDEIIDKSKSFEEQIKSLKKRKDLEGFYSYKDYDDKELKFKYFKIELAKLSDDIDEKLFEQIFGHTIIKLTDKLINTTDKEENQIIVDSIKKNKDKLSEMKDYSNEWVIQPNRQRINLLDTIDLILNFNEKLNQIWFKKYKK